MSDFNHDYFIGEEYRIRKSTSTRKPVLVSIFSQSFPFGISGNDYYSKTMLEDTQGYKADVDAVYLQHRFKELYYPEIAEVVIENNRPKSDIIKYIQNLGDSQEYLQYDYFFFVFLTYNGSTIYKDERIHLSDGMCHMQDIFDEVKTAKALVMKPKIFLIQCDDINLLEEMKEYGKGIGDQKKPVKIPQDADRLVIMSDIPQRLANPDLKADENPSFLIQAFGETLIENSRRPPEFRQDLFSLTADINCKVQAFINDLLNKGNKRTDEMKVPLVTSTLTKLVKI